MIIMKYVLFGRKFLIKHITSLFKMLFSLISFLKQKTMDANAKGLGLI